METWQAVLLAVAAMTAFLILVVASVVAVLYFLPASFAERRRHRRHR